MVLFNRPRGLILRASLRRSRGCGRAVAGPREPCLPEQRDGKPNLVDNDGVEVLLQRLGGLLSRHACALAKLHAQELVLAQSVRAGVEEGLRDSILGVEVVMIGGGDDWHVCMGVGRWK